MKTLVTGADGFIGSHLVEDLVLTGHSVKAFCYYNSFNHSGWIENLDKSIVREIEVVFGDVRDFWSVKNAIKNCNKVFNLAALIGIPYSYVAPAEYIETNVKGALNILQAIKDEKNCMLIQLSTSEVYGSAQFVPMTENHPINPQSPYAASKVASDSLAISYNKSFDLPVIVARPFNTYGPRQSLRAVIPTIINQILNKNKKIKLGAIDTLRDFTYVKDTTKGLIAISNSQSSIGQTINIGSNFEISIEQIVSTVSHLLKTNVEIIQDKKRVRPKKSEVSRLKACNKKIKKLTNWNPSFSGIKGFRRGINETIEWFKVNNKLKNSLYNV